MTLQYQERQQQQELSPPPLAAVWVQDQGYRQKQGHQTIQLKTEQKPLNELTWHRR